MLKVNLLTYIQAAAREAEREARHLAEAGRIRREAAAAAAEKQRVGDPCSDVLPCLPVPRTCRGPGTSLCRPLWRRRMTRFLHNGQAAAYRWALLQLFKCQSASQLAAYAFK